MAVDIKATIKNRTNANITYIAALLGMSKSDAAGYVLDTVAGNDNPERVAKSLKLELEEPGETVDSESSDPS